MTPRELWYHEWHLLRTIMRGARLDPDIPDGAPGKMHVWDTVFGVLYRAAHHDFPRAAECRFGHWPTDWWRRPDERWKVYANLRLSPSAVEAHRLASKRIA